MRFWELRRIIEECEPLNKLTQSYQSGTVGKFKWTGENIRTVVWGSEEEKANTACLYRQLSDTSTVKHISLMVCLFLSEQMPLNYSSCFNYDLMGFFQFLCRFPLLTLLTVLLSCSCSCTSSSSSTSTYLDLNPLPRSPRGKLCFSLLIGTIFPVFHVSINKLFHGWG